MCANVLSKAHTKKRKGAKKMKNFKKRFLSSVVALAMILSSFTFTAMAEAVEITNDMIYADKYGIEISFTEVPSADDYEIAVKDSLGNIVETSDVTADEENKLLNVHFITPITAGETYTVKINDTYKDITVTEAVYEDFEDAAFDGFSNVGTDTAKVKSGATNVEYSTTAGRVFATEDEIFNASENDRKMVIIGDSGSASHIRATGLGGVTNALTERFTYSMEIQRYKKAGENDYAYAYMWVGGNSPATKSRAFSFAGGKSRLSATTYTEKVEATEDSKGWPSMNFGTSDSETEYGYSVTSPLKYGNIQDFDSTTGKYTTDDEATVAGAPATHAIRVVDTKFAGYVGNDEGMTFTGTLAEPAVNLDETTYNRKQFGILASYCGKSLLVVDDITVTKCTVENSAGDIFITEPATFTKEDVYADLYGVQIQFESHPMLSQRENVMVTTLVGDEVQAEPVYDADNKILNVHFAAPITAGEYYNLDVDGEKVTFKVKKILNIDFEGSEFDGFNTTGEDANKDVTTSGLKFTATAGKTTTANCVDGGVFVTDSADFNASATDRKLVLFGHQKTFKSNGIPSGMTMGADDSRFTYYLETQRYKLGTYSMDRAFMFLGANNIYNGTKAFVLGAGNKSRLSASTATAVDGWPKNDVSFTEADKNGNPYYGTTLTTTATTGKLTDFENFTTGEYTSANPVAGKVNHSIRVVDRKFSGYAGVGNDLQFTGTFDEPETDDVPTFGVVGAYAATDMTVIDNMMITISEVIDFIDNAEVIKYYADMYGLDVVFNAPLSLEQQETEVEFTTATGAAVEFEKEYDADNQIVRLIFDEPIERDTPYIFEMGDVKRIITVETVFEDDFNDLKKTDGTNPTLEDSASFRNKYYASGDFVAQFFAHSVGTSMWTADAKYGASQADKKVVVSGGDYGAMAWIENVPKDSTVTAKLDRYAPSGWTFIQMTKTDAGVKDKGIATTIESGLVRFAPQNATSVDPNNTITANTGAAGKIDAEGTFTQPTYHPHVAQRSYASEGEVVDMMAGFVADGNATPEYQGTIDISDSADVVNPSTGKNSFNKYVLTGETTKVGFATHTTAANLVVNDVIITTSRDDAYVADATFTNDDIYVDLYGAQIQLDAPPSLSQRENTVVTNLKGEEVELKTSYDETNKIFNIHFAQPIQPDTFYNINVDGQKAAFKVEYVLNEGFDGAAFDGFNTFNADKATITKQSNGQTFAVSKGGIFVTDSADFNASQTDRKLVISGSYANKKSFRTYQGLDGITMGEDNSRFTYYAEVQRYKKNDTSLSYAHMLVGSTDIFYGAKAFVVGEKASRLSASTGNSTTIPGWPTTDMTFATASKDGVPFNGTTLNTSLTALNGTITGYVEETGEYTSATKATPVNHSIRVVDRKFSGYAGIGNDLQFTGTFAEPVSDRTGTEKTLGFGTSYEGATLVVDNMRVTKCTVVEPVADATFTNDDIYADLYGAQIQLDTPASLEQQSNTVVTTLRGAKVEATTKFDAENKILNVHFAEPISANTSYVLDVNGQKAAFKVEYVLNEDFEGAAFDGLNTTTATSTTSITSNGIKYDVTAGTVTDQAGGVFITDSADFNASATDRKIAVFGFQKTIKTSGSLGDSLMLNDDSRFTYYLETQRYKLDSNSVDDVYMFLGANNMYNGAKAFAIQTNKSKLSATTGPNTSVEGWPGTSFSTSSSNIGGATLTAPNYNSGTVTGFDFTTSTYTSATKATPVNHAIRQVDRKFSGYAGVGNDLQFTGTFAEPIANTVATLGIVTSWAGKAMVVIDDMRVTKCSVESYEDVGPQVIAVESITADKNAIYVEFDADVFEEGDNFSQIKVMSNGDEVDYEITVDGKIATIVPDGGVKSGTKYTVIVPEGFAPSSVATTEEEFTKTFRLTVYADENFADTDLKVEVSDNAMFDNGRLVLRDATLSIPSVAAATDYVVEFDAQIYSAAINKANEELLENDTLDYPVNADYYKSVPSINMWYNADSENKGGYNWFINEQQVKSQFVDADGQVTTYETVSTTPLTFGDAFYIEEDYNDFVKEGINFFNSHSFEDLELWMWSGSKSTTRPTPDVYSVKVNKTGKAAGYYVDGELVSAIAGDENNAATASGVFGITVSDDEFVVIDNLFVYCYEEFEDIAVSVDASDVTVENISASEKPVVIVVAAYDKDGAMVDAWVDPKTTLSAGETYNAPTSLSAASAVTYKAFVWDNMTNLVPYCVPGQYNVQ